MFGHAQDVHALAAGQLRPGDETFVSFEHRVHSQCGLPAKQ